MTRPSGIRTLEGSAWFNSATFQRDAGFGEAIFHNARFNSATFEGDARFNEVTFKGDTLFNGTTFQGDARFSEATFERAQQFGPLLAQRGLNLDGVHFTRPVRIEASTMRMCCRQAQFLGGVQFRLRWARVVLDDTDIPAPSLLTGIPGFTSEKLALAEQRIARNWKDQYRPRKGTPAHRPEQPRPPSLRRANVAGLGLTNVDLADCRFAGAHNLDRAA